jgi:hypothetical protein
VAVEGLGPAYPADKGSGSSHIATLLAYAVPHGRYWPRLPPGGMG